MGGRGEEGGRERFTSGQKARGHANKRKKASKEEKPAKTQIVCQHTDNERRNRVLKASHARSWAADHGWTPTISLRAAKLSCFSRERKQGLGRINARAFLAF